MPQQTPDKNWLSACPFWLARNIAFFARLLLLQDKVRSNLFIFASDQKIGQRRSGELSDQEIIPEKSKQENGKAVKRKESKGKTNAGKAVEQKAPEGTAGKGKAGA